MTQGVGLRLKRDIKFDPTIFADRDWARQLGYMAAPDAQIGKSEIPLFWPTADLRVKIRELPFVTKNQDTDNGIECGQSD